VLLSAAFEDGGGLAFPAVTENVWPIRIRPCFSLRTICGTSHNRAFIRSTPDRIRNSALSSLSDDHAQERGVRLEPPGLPTVRPFLL